MFGSSPVSYTFLFRRSPPFLASSSSLARGRASQGKVYRLRNALFIPMARIGRGGGTGATLLVTLLLLLAMVPVALSPGPPSVRMNHARYSRFPAGPRKGDGASA